jgi:hypothetical protein
VFKSGLQDVAHVLPDGVGISLVPRAADRRLLGRKDVHETGREAVELEALLDVTVKRHGVELREDVDVANAGVDAVTYGKVDKAVLAGDRHGRLRPLPRQREETAAPSSAQDHSQHACG